MIRLALLALTIGLTILTSRSGVAEADCDSGATCNAAAKAALENGDREAALRAFLRQVDLATGERRTNGNDDALICDGFENLARLSIALGKPLRGNAWGQVARLKCMPNPDLQARAGDLRNMVAPDPIAGLYWSYAGYGQWSEMTLTDRGSGKFQVEWYVQRYGLVPSADAYGPAALWQFEGPGERIDGRFTVRYDGVGLDGEGTPCALDFEVQPFALVVATDLPTQCQNGGSSAYPRGTFWRVEAD